MEKTTIYLTAEQKAALTSAAREQGRSEARLIREGIDRVLTRDSAAEEPRARPRWMTRETFAREIGPAQADVALTDELRTLAPDLTDELPSR